MLRHYFANERRKSGWDLPLISKALGHKHISTTESYLNLEQFFLCSRKVLLQIDISPEILFDFIRNADELSQATDEYYSQNKALFMVDKLI